MQYPMGLGLGQELGLGLGQGQGLGTSDVGMPNKTSAARKYFTFVQVMSWNEIV